jgi:ribosomal protein S27E
LFGFRFRPGRETNINLARENAEDLLQRGLAAAQSGNPRDYEEAEYFLEWVLLTDSDLDQQVQAWYWLSRITDDPKRKHECLENALAVNPAHPESRRDLAILEGRLKPEEMRANPLQPGASVVPGRQVTPGEIRRFKCPKCGASVVYNPALGVAQCQFCGSRINEQGQLAQPTGPASTGVSDQDWVAAIYTEKGHRWVLPQQRVLKCQGCGATVTFSPSHVSAVCSYCGSPYVVQPADQGMADLRQPDGIIPFAFDAHGAIYYSQFWLQHEAAKMGIPDDLAALAALGTPTAIYLPFWTFDMAGEVRWSGWVRPGADIGGVNVDDVDTAARVGGAALGLLVGDMNAVARSVGGMATKKYDRSNMVHTNGSVGVVSNDILVPATTSLPDEMLRKMMYDTKRAVPYNEQMLAHWPAEIYSTSLADASLSARDVALQEADRQIELTAGQLPNSNDSLQVDRSGLSVLSYKLLLVPIWAGSYSYKGQVYKLLVNGQNGQAEGDAPGGSSLIARFFAQYQS